MLKSSIAHDSSTCYLYLFTQPLKPDWEMSLPADPPRSETEHYQSPHQYSDGGRIQGCVQTVAPLFLSNSPAWIKQHAGSRGTRSKTDRTDAWLIADYALRHQPACWTPPPPAHAKLRALVARRDQLLSLLTMEKNRQHDRLLPEAVHQSLSEVIKTLSAQIEFIDKEIDDSIAADPRLAQGHTLLQTIPGFGRLSAAQLLAYMPPLDQFEKARQLCAFAGLSPRHKTSGTSLNARPCLSKQGCGALRRCVFMPAMAAIRSFLKEFHLRLQSNGKTPKAALGAAMRKLLALAFAILRSGKPFDPLFYKKASAAS